jgi:hypothetical protein
MDHTAYLTGDRDGLFDCSFAIVMLPQGAQRAPPKRLDAKGFPWIWPDDRPEPDQSNADQKQPIEFIRECGVYWSQTSNGMIRSALTAPDRPVFTNHDSLFLYSAAQPVAAMVRLGD